MKKLLTICVLLTATALFAQQPMYLLAGTYTGGKSKGIYVYRFLPDGSAIIVDSVVTANPSFLAVAPNRKYVYAVNETGAEEGGGKISAYAFDAKKGKLRFINQVPAEGNHPCYITVDRTGKWVIAGNYSSGNVVVLPVGKGGSIGKATTTVQHKGSSTHRRQEAPHVHATVLSDNNRFLYVPDLGKDKLMIYAFDERTGRLLPNDTTLALPPGSGPRHVDFHPTKKWVYLLQELSGTVTVFENGIKGLQPMQTISVLPESFSGTFTSADVHVSPDGRFLYTTTRDEANLITVFRIHPRTGKLTVAGQQSTLGKTPRNFTLHPSGNFLLAANQRSDEVVIFHVNKQTGLLTDSGKRISVGSPVCLKWIR